LTLLFGVSFSIVILSKSVLSKGRLILLVGHFLFKVKFICFYYTLINFSSKI